MATVSGYLHRFLDSANPFHHLDAAERARVADRAAECEVAPGHVLFAAGDEGDDVFLIARGSIELVGDVGAPAASRVALVGEGRTVGDWEALFGMPRLLGARAYGTLIAFRIDAQTFRDLLAASARFALGYGALLRSAHGLFRPFDRFKLMLLEGAERGHIEIDALVPAYRSLEPAIHPGAADERVDLAALAYAVRRLPENVTRTVVYHLVDETPAEMAGSADRFPRVGSAARRRDVRESLPGTNLVWLRPGDSDLIDLATCLCLFAVEAAKLRSRVARDPSAAARISSGDASPDEIPFSRRERAALTALWGAALPQRLSDLVRHSGSISLHIARRRGASRTLPGEAWVSQIAAAIRDLTGRAPADMDPARRVHIVSSNTHSVVNCLNPFIHARRDAILAWAREVAHPAVEREWHDATDALYTVAREWRAAHPEAAGEEAGALSAAGHLHLGAPTGTGIEVQLIDLGRLAERPVDPALAAPSGAGDLIVNIDYAFGEQAEAVMRELLLLFGHAVASVSFLGKAGALVGHRGDILVPTAFVEQSSDQFQPVAPLADPVTWSGGPRIHRGAMLTVDGTLLQNRRMLHFYRHVWRVVGIEMEGSWYYRQIREAAALGVIPDDVPTRCYYYVSDVPLDHDATLAAPLGVGEGIPPLYAVTRRILNAIFTE